MEKDLNIGDSQNANWWFDEWFGLRSYDLVYSARLKYKFAVHLLAGELRDSYSALSLGGGWPVKGPLDYVNEVEENQPAR